MWVKLADESSRTELLCGSILQMDQAGQTCSVPFVNRLHTFKDNIVDFFLSSEFSLTGHVLFHIKVTHKHIYTVAIETGDG